LIKLMCICLQTVLAGQSAAEAASAQDDATGDSQRTTGPGGNKGELADRERNYYEINNDFLDNA
jgi:hypothetical protein